MVNKRKTRSFINVFSDIYGRFPGNRKKQFWLVFIYIVFVSAIATITTGSIALFAVSFSSPERVLNSKYIVTAHGILQMEFLTSPKGIMIFLSALMVFLVGMKNVLESIQLYLVARFGAAMEAYFGTVLLKGFIHMPYQWHLNRNSADLILAVQWRSYIGHYFINSVLTIMSAISLTLFLVVVLLLVNPYMSIIVLVLSGITAYLIYKKVHHLQEREAWKCKEYDISINRQVTKGIHGIKDVKVSGQTSFITHFEKAAYHYSRIQGMRNVFGKIPKALLETIGFAMLSGTAVFMLFFAKSSSVEVTGFIGLLIVAAWRILPATNTIMTLFLSIRNNLPYIRVEMGHINDIEQHAVYPPSLDNNLFESLAFENEIRLKNIHFAYQNRKESVLTDINLCIKKGQTVGVVGCSGVGKSTLVDITIGLLNPDKGQVVIDGYPLDISNYYAWMKKLSYVPQSPYIFDGSIAENIAFGVEVSEIDMDFVLECSRMAYMQDVLDILPQGIDTLIGERGVRLSGGQRQRVAIARALYTRPELMIFDEATSSLDMKSERAIQSTIGTLRGSKTLIIVAHRLKTVEQCDLVIWLEAGKVRLVDRPEKVLCEYEESLL
jgi:ATP-binding cassette, subfamily B, bacterial PglK